MLREINDVCRWEHLYIFRINDDTSSQGKLHFLNVQYFEKLDNVSLGVIRNPYFNFLVCTLYYIFRTSIPFYNMITFSPIASLIGVLGRKSVIQYFFKLLFISYTSHTDYRYDIYAIL